MLPAVNDLQAALQRLVPGSTISVEGSALLIEAPHLHAVCRALKESPDYQLDHVSNLTAVDYPPLPAAPTNVQQEENRNAPQAGRIEMIYHLDSTAKKHGPVTLKVKLPRGNPVVGSLVPLYRGAEYQEREVYDLYGVTFPGHPDLRRILMWEEFTGHPMRKDYLPEDQDALDPSATWKSA